MVKEINNQDDEESDIEGKEEQIPDDFDEDDENDEN